MGYVNAEIQLSNPRLPELSPLASTALVDTGALMLCIPAQVALQLQLEQDSLREITLAQGRVMQVPYVGPLRVDVAGRFCYVGALVHGDGVLLGAVPLEDMDLVVNPARQRLEPDPRSPTIPHALVKGMNAVAGRA